MSRTTHGHSQPGRLYSRFRATVNIFTAETLQELQMKHGYRTLGDAPDYIVRDWSIQKRAALIAAQEAEQ